jgi:hypothetical protein
MGSLEVNDLTTAHGDRSPVRIHLLLPHQSSSKENIHLYTDIFHDFFIFMEIFSLVSSHDINGKMATISKTFFHALKKVEVEVEVEC